MTDLKRSDFPDNGLGVIPPYNKTKKAVKEAVTSGEAVTVYGTSLFHDTGPWSVDELPDGTYSLVGPDPHRKRTWFGTLKVSHSSTGKRLVSVS